MRILILALLLSLSANTQYAVQLMPHFFPILCPKDTGISDWQEIERHADEQSVHMA